MLSEISIRDYPAETKIAVDEWIASGNQFHVMRDHPSHFEKGKKHPSTCVAEQQYIRTVITDILTQFLSLYIRMQRKVFLILVHLNLL